ncbi:HipA domain-containing protein [Ramlibacter sp. WS9]|uniref:HipA domain-containing protein n=1 Tax=Ramlibacter sp. WS9 TaxID=1882741 RepID=UPI001142F959|nr:HipA domain-containing protein [Ramlibacter sp. WS9]ROZ64955.1 type II toxin-antitoxin system HipA family toxin [Ramlibacter sp. WS9]
MAQPNLDVWMNGEHVGTWFWTRTGTAGFRYSDTWLRSEHMRPLSLSLPIPAGRPEIHGRAVEHWFDNLLPDSERIRERLRRRFRSPSASAADLLAAIGRDCVGAVQLLPAGSPPPKIDRIESQPLTEAKVESILRNVTADDRADDDGEDLRISIAGAQEKTALLRIGRRWHKPLGATPTTHIFKLPLGLVGNMRADMTSSVENEWVCGQLLAALGFNIAPAEMARFGTQKVLIVERFDRRLMDSGTWIARLPQEDFCQAQGVPSQLKYESDGGPGIAAGLKLLSASAGAQEAKLNFVLAQLAFWLMAATDGHAKNFSIFLGPGGVFRMTPLYDVLSAWPIIGNGANQLSPRRAKLAMALRSKNVHYHLHEVHTRHWQLLAAQSGVPGAFDRMVALVRAVPDALDTVEASLPEGFPLKVWKPIRAGVLAHAARFGGPLK